MSRDQPLVLDAMLGRLCTYLRMCGYDAAYAPDEDLDADDDIRAFARTTGRTLVTRDRDLAARTPGSLLLESCDIEAQLAELATAGFDLDMPADPARCGACNGSLTRVRATTGTPGHVPDPAETDVWQCSDCGQHFWRGSHWDDVATRLATVDRDECGNRSGDAGENATETSR